MESNEYVYGYDYAVGAILDVLADAKAGYVIGGLSAEADAIAYAIKIVKAQAADIKIGLNS